MNIFNYLMNKKGHTIFKNDDVLSYLLNKYDLYTATGTEINITNAKGFNSLEMSKLSIQDGTPTPENPVEVKTVKGYRNLFDIADGTYTTGTSPSASITFKDGKMTNLTHNFTQNFGIKIPLRAPITLTANQSYTRKNNSGGAYPYIALYDSNSSTIDTMAYADNGVKIYTPTEAKEVHYIYLWFQYNLTYTQINPMMNEGTTIQPFAPYGTNYIYTTITSGANSRIITIPLNDNEICGIGDYKDELVIDKNGNAKLVKKIGKVVLDGSEAGWGAHQYGTNSYQLSNYIRFNFSDVRKQVMSNYFKGISAKERGVETNTIYSSNSILIVIRNTDFTSLNDFKTWLGTHNIELYYELAESTEIDLGTVDLTLYDGTNNITNSEDMNMVLEYYK